jgi:dTDP-4-amino-4,6-dideoxy-D-galactose acyltransferase
MNCEIVKKLEWESDFFGFSMGQFTSNKLDEHNYKEAHKACEDKNIQFLQVLAESHDYDSIRQAELQGFNFTDVRITLELKLNEIKLKQQETEFSYGLATTKHIDALKIISDGMFKDSRFYFDKNFTEHKVDELFQLWVEKAILGTFDHECFCFFQNEQPICFGTIRYNSKKEASLGLLGVDKNFRGKKISNRLLTQMCSFLIKSNIEVFTVVTQGRNYAAQRCYQQAGFRTQNVEFWYHKWLTNPKML